ncbi:MAG: HD domain-containing protein [Anaerolineaceae bacterium]|nr:HD domain-containing protein [Anaerolineaceae bacterium]
MGMESAELAMGGKAGAKAGAKAPRDWGRRLRQGVRSLLAPVLPLDVSPARALLNDAQFALFCRMRRAEQQHALRVHAAVQEQAEETPLELARAALLHDIGKIRCPLSVLGKTWAVLLEDWRPRASNQWPSPERVAFWQRPQYVMSQHPAWGAELAEEASLDERTCWLIAEHQTPLPRWHPHPDGTLLQRLQAADRQQ